MELGKTIVKVKKGPPAKGQYSQVVTAGPFVFMSGQLPFSPEGVLAEGDIAVQTKQIMENIGMMLEEAGSSLNKVVKVGVYLLDLNDFPAMNKVYSTYFPTEPPVRTTIAVSDFPPGVRIEIDVVAMR